MCAHTPHATCHFHLGHVLGAHFNSFLWCKYPWPSAGRPADTGAASGLQALTSAVQAPACDTGTPVSQAGMSPPSPSEVLSAGKQFALWAQLAHAAALRGAGRSLHRHNYALRWVRRNQHTKSLHSNVVRYSYRNRSRADFRTGEWHFELLMWGLVADFFRTTDSYPNKPEQ